MENKRVVMMKANREGSIKSKEINTIKKLVLKNFTTKDIEPFLNFQWILFFNCDRPLSQIVYENTAKVKKYWLLLFRAA